MLSSERIWAISEGSAERVKLSQCILQIFAEFARRLLVVVDALEAAFAWFGASLLDRGEDISWLRLEAGIDCEYNVI